MGDEECLLSVEDVSQDKWVGLVGAACLSPERTGKVGTAACPGSGDAVGRAAVGNSLLPGGKTTVPGDRGSAALLGGCGGGGNWQSRRRKRVAASVTKEAGEDCCWLGLGGDQ